MFDVSGMITVMDEAKNNYLTNTILTNVIAFLAPVIGIAIVIFCVIQGFKLLKGQPGASIKSLLIGVGVLLLILGIMYVAGSFDTYGTLFKGATDNVIQNAGKDVENIVKK